MEEHKLKFLFNCEHSIKFIRLYSAKSDVQFMCEIIELEWRNQRNRCENRRTGGRISEHERTAPCLRLFFPIQL